MAFPYDVPLFRITTKVDEDQAPRTEVLTRVRTANENLLLFTGYNCRIRQTESCYELILNSQEYDTTQNLMQWEKVDIVVIASYKKYLEDMYPLTNGPPKSKLQYRIVDVNTWEISPVQIQVDASSVQSDIPHGKIIFTGSTHIERNTFAADWLTELDFGHAMICVPSRACFAASSLVTVKGPHIFKIDEFAFAGAGLLAVTDEQFPHVSSLKKGAFMGCTRLELARLSNVTRLSGDCFYSCTSLRTVEFELVTVLRSHTFYNCRRLSEIYFPNVQQAQGRSTFAECSALSLVSMPELLTIDVYMFSNSSVTDVVFPKVTSISQYAFSGCAQLRSVSIPMARDMSSVVFEDCESLSVTCPPTLPTYFFPRGSVFTYTHIFPPLG